MASPRPAAARRRGTRTHGLTRASVGLARSSREAARRYAARPSPARAPAPELKPRFANGCVPRDGRRAQGYEAGAGKIRSACGGASGPGAATGRGARARLRSAARILATESERGWDTQPRGGPYMRPARRDGDGGVGHFVHRDRPAHRETGARVPRGARMIPRADRTGRSGERTTAAVERWSRESELALHACAGSGSFVCCCTASASARPGRRRPSSRRGRGRSTASTSPVTGRARSRAAAATPARC